MTDQRRKHPKSSFFSLDYRKREALAAYGFLAPNFVGFLLFTSLPVLASLYLAFTNWDFFGEPKWIGLFNFKSLVGMHREGSRLVPNDPFLWKYVFNTVFLMIGIPIGMAGSLIMALLLNQKMKGVVVFRTLYFLPTVCSGVAVLILWRYLYNDDIGLFNLLIEYLGRIYVWPGRFALIPALLSAGCGLCFAWLIGFKVRLPKIVLFAAGVGIFYYALFRPGHGLVGWIVLSLAAHPPQWLTTVEWAKPSLIIMGLWAAIGGYNMILYLAALQGVPREYYEAAAIDGAGSWGKFWHVTWPMISPTTFFILIMSIIGGFQGGFMTAHVMTGGGPAGSTKTIEFYLYEKAFVVFHAGYACAIAWLLFAVIFVLTLLTWRFGGRAVVYE